MESDRTGLLIIRAWVEEGSSEPLRAQIRLSTDVSTGFEREMTLARSEEVCATVQAWLADISGRAERSDSARCPLRARPIPGRAGWRWGR